MSRSLHADVVIAGGGLAGLSLAHQLKNQHNDLDIIVLEKNTFPVPEAVAKIGESTVEIGSHYLTDTIGLGDHFKDNHLRKFGLRCFFGNSDSDFSNLDELGVSQSFAIPTYQIDRGVIENHLARTVTEMGVRIFDGITIQSVDVGNRKHTVAINGEHLPRQISSRWLVDSAGRQALLKTKLNLAKTNTHNGNAVWFRIDRRIELDDWTTNEEWHRRCTPSGERWLSTNHLMGPGYWVWIIPLASGVTSIGIVMDDTVFHSNDFSTVDKAKNWLEKHQSHLAQAIDGADVLDFAAIKDYSYGCKQLFGDTGWAITGEAGFFADPFYSPGSDFIAINNTFISNLMAREKAGGDIRLDSAIYQKLFNSFYESTLSLYTNEYGGFGDRKLMAVKLLWDYAYYWGVLGLLFFQKTISDIPWMRANSMELLKAQQLNTLVQTRFRQRAEQRLVLPARGAFINQYEIPCLRYFNKTLLEADMRDPVAQLKINVAMLEKISGYIVSILDGNATGRISSEEVELLGEYRYLVTVS